MGGSTSTDRPPVRRGRSRCRVRRRCRILGGRFVDRTTGPNKAPRLKENHDARPGQASNQTIPLRGRCPLSSDLPTWRDRVRRIADSGYSTLLMPDVPTWQPALGPTLATAAALADLRIGSWVYAAALREPWSTAWEAHSLSVLTEGRFEMGIGAGRPGIEVELGRPAVSPAERRARMRETVAALRRSTAPICARRWSWR